MRATCGVVDGLASPHSPEYAHDTVAWGATCRTLAAWLSFRARLAQQKVPARHQQVRLLRVHAHGALSVWCHILAAVLCIACGSARSRGCAVDACASTTARRRVRNHQRLERAQCSLHAPPRLATRLGATAHHRPQSLGHGSRPSRSGVQQGRERGVVVGVRDDFDQRLSILWTRIAGRHQLGDQDAEAVTVALDADAAGRNILRRHVTQRPDFLAHLDRHGHGCCAATVSVATRTSTCAGTTASSFSAVIAHACTHRLDRVHDAKITEPGRAVAVHEDVLGLHVEVHDGSILGSRVQEDQAARHVDQALQALPPRKGPGARAGATIAPGRPQAVVQVTVHALVDDARLLLAVQLLRHADPNELYQVRAAVASERPQLVV
mmetsp:Transcript_15997/g.55860  ORF Transcript_15997/g.55860 Transcript_15997/m.55860 type:complete len:380 (-) Transcript_15997:2146-3285(-)